MNEPTKAFISYNHADRHLLNSLLQVMRSGEYVKRIEPLFDDVLRENPSDLYGSISRLLNKSHIAVALITKNWLKSNSTRDEFIRAHERRKKLFCIFKIDDDISESQIPHYIKGDLRFEFNEENFDYIAHVLCKSILNYKNHWQLKVFDKLKLLGDIFEKEGKKNQSQVYTVKHFEQKMNSTLKELESIVQDQFSVNVSYEQNFLESAKPYFQSANKIYAVSLIGISTFWVDNNTPIGIKQAYLDAHSGDNKSIVRLFVFATPIEANYYKNVLQANYEYYGQKPSGNVLFCSKSSYEMLLTRTFFENQDNMNKSEKDFGILFYSEHEFVHEAILENGKMFIKKIDLNSVDSYTKKRFVEEISDNKKLKDLEKFGIIKWEQKYHESNKEWSKALERAFTHKFSPFMEVVHSVFFNVNKDVEAQFKEIITELLSMLEENKEELNVANYYFRKKAINTSTLIDGKWGGSLNFMRHFNYTISIKFNDKRTLPDYYKNLEHSDIRRKLYELLNPAVINKYAELDIIYDNLFTENGEKDSEIEDKIRIIYRDIENLMTPKYIMRFDFENDLSFERIASMRGYSFLNFDR